MRRELLVLLALSAPALPAAAEEVPDLKDWVVRCDNVRYCVALGLEKEDAVEGAFLRLTRSAAALAEPTIEVVTATTTPGRYRIRLAFDDPALASPILLDAGEPDENDTVRAQIPQEAVAPFVEGLRRGKVLHVTQLQGDAETLTARIGLDEAPQALAHLDEAQGRGGTTNALAAPGDKAPAGPAADPELPVVVAAKPVGSRPAPGTPKAVARLLRTADCDEPPNVRPIRERLDAKTSLWGFLCWRGAYNETYAFFVYREGENRAAPAVFQYATLRGEEPDSNTLTNPDFSRKALTIGFFDLGRGVGDCGQAGRYVWDGRQFALLELTSMPACRGVSLPDWPATWRARMR
ncbi:MAG TPA: DUF1176 domain-containing protein [Microvirga sp.]|jgi:hypothetical protein|nr:DUF1176 domain-containing protein [Microvirga sp.]